MNDGTGLINAIILYPLEDTPRLIYADWLDEHGRPDEAELIRKQVGLSRFACLTPSIGALIRGRAAPCYMCRPRSKRDCLPWCALCCERDDQMSRERELLATLSPTCPVCEGLGDIVWSSEDGGSPPMVCPHCEGKCRCPCTFDRGFLTHVRVPTIESVIEDCERCKGAGWHDREPGDGEMNCFACGGNGWQLTDFARKLLPHPLLTRIAPVHRVPEEGAAGGWFWTVNVHDPNPAYNLPKLVFDKLKGFTCKTTGVIRLAYYPTRAAAVDALAVAVCEVVRKLGASVERTR